MKKNYILNILGIFFLILSISAIINTIYRDNVDGILWLCYPGLFIISIGLLLKKDDLISSQLNILTIPLTVWSVDYFSFFIFGETLLGITDYMFMDFPLTSKLISFQHVFTLPLSFYALYLIRLKTKDIWKISFVQLILTFIITRLLTSSESNINYVYRFNKLEILPDIIYPVAWFLAFFIIVFITNYAIEKLLKNNNPFLKTI
ncbi:hypothetical protein J4221_01380 [Candidatus Pacearchaeota archaeon]|nr:hypothetical protein [Candidatus Pacearchaeota archaeon]